MEALEVAKELIANLGFPIAMVGYFIWDKSRLTNQMTTAINNNNILLEKILAKLDVLR